MQFPFIFSLLLSFPLFFFLIFIGSFKRILCESESVSYSIGSEVWGSMDCTPSGFSVHGILQARVLEWVAIPFSRGSSQPRDQTQVSCIAGRHFNLWATREAPSRDHEIKTYRNCYLSHITQLLSVRIMTWKPCQSLKPKLLNWMNILISNNNLCFLGGVSGKESTCQCRRHKRRRFDPWVSKIPWRRK